MKAKITPSKKISFKPIIFILSLFFTVLNSYSETNPTVSLGESATCRYSGCAAKDVTITNSFIGKLDETPYFKEFITGLFK
nr:hypothetical protein [uncultured Flavobacterium sp.]